MDQFLEIFDRAAQGESLPAETFDLDRVYANLKELTRKYEIKCDPQHPVPADDALADRVFAAAVEFFAACGVYFLDLKTVLKLTREEIVEAVAGYARPARFGEGAEAGTMQPRRPDSTDRPWLHVGSGTVASTEQIARQIIRGNASILAADSMSINALSSVAGHAIKPGAPAEIFGALRSIELAREAFGLAGRPGLPILNGIAAAASALGTIGAAGCPTGLRPSDAIIVGTLAELKTNQQMMAKAAWCLASGTNIVLASAPMLGGYAGGPEGVAVLNTAYALFGMTIYQCNVYLTLPIDIRLSCSTTRGVIWATALSCQAIARNTRLPTVALGYNCGGPWTESFYRESAAFTAAVIASGASFQTPHPAKAVLTDYVTPMEMAVTTRMALATTGMTRKEADRVVSAILPTYEAGLASAPTGKPYPECFDLETGRPQAAYHDFVEKIETDLAGLGMPR